MLSPLRVQLPADLGFRHRELAHPLHTPYGASLAFNTFTHLWLLPHTPSRAFQRLASLWLSHGNPQQCTCLFGVGFPLPRPQVWTFTSCLLIMPNTLPRIRAEALILLLDFAAADIPALLLRTAWWDARTSALRRLGISAFLAGAPTTQRGAQAAWAFCAGKGGDRAAGGGHGAKRPGSLILAPDRAGTKLQAHQPERNKRWQKKTDPPFGGPARTWPTKKILSGTVLLR